MGILGERTNQLLTMSWLGNHETKLRSFAPKQIDSGKWLSLVSHEA